MINNINWLQLLGVKTIIGHRILLQEEMLIAHALNISLNISFKLFLCWLTSHS